MEIIVFTNGCFDLLHPGHVDLLKKARALGTKLIVGLNSDRSARAIKGASRPFLDETARAAVLRELRSVDEVRIFDENTPEKLIREIKPDVLVKGGDWTVEQIIGADFVLKNGGQVFSIPFVENFSSSKIAEKIKSADNSSDTAESKITASSDLIENFLESQIEGFERLLSGERTNIARCAEIIFKVIADGNKIFICEEAGSEAFSQYLAFEFNRRVKRKNLEKSAIRLQTLDISIENPDKIYPLEDVHLKELKNSGREGDLLIVISALETSSTVISTIMKGRALGCRIIGITGINSVKLNSLCDASVSIQFKNADRSASAYTALAKLWRQLIDKKIKHSSGFQNG